MKIDSYAPSLGPHEGKELQLMLLGQKDIALFYEDSPIPEEFAPYLQSKALFCRAVECKTRIDNMLMHFYIISRFEHDPRIQRLITLIQHSLIERGFQENIEREIGQILGYCTEDIEYYIVRMQQKMQ